MLLLAAVVVSLVNMVGDGTMAEEVVPLENIEDDATLEEAVTSVVVVVTEGVRIEDTVKD